MFSGINDSVVNYFHSFRLGNGKQLSKCLYSSDEGDFQLAEYECSDLPQLSVNSGTVRTVVVSDTHNRHQCLSNIPPCDILFHCGDIFMTSRMFTEKENRRQLLEFNEWLGTIPAKHIVVVGGNHDGFIESLGKDQTAKLLSNALYLVNEVVELCGLRIWASPVSLGASENKAFQSKAFFKQSVTSRMEAGDNVDIVVTHSSCSDLVRSFPPTRAHFYGHIHARHGGRVVATTVQDAVRPDVLVRKQWVSICGAIMDHNYNPVQLPIVYDLNV